MPGIVLSPFALSLSKGRSSYRRAQEAGRGFDKLSPNGLGGVHG